MNEPTETRRVVAADGCSLTGAFLFNFFFLPFTLDHLANENKRLIVHLVACYTRCRWPRNAVTRRSLMNNERERCRWRVKCLSWALGSLIPLNLKLEKCWTQRKWKWENCCQLNKSRLWRREIVTWISRSVPVCFDNRVVQTCWHRYTVQLDNVGW